MLRTYNVSYLIIVSNITFVNKAITIFNPVHMFSDIHRKKVNLSGRILHLSCTCDRNQLHTTTWSKDGREISVNDPEGKFRIPEDRLSLVIAGADHLDVGKYTCNIKCGNHRLSTEIEFNFGNFSSLN